MPSSPSPKATSLPAPEGEPGGHGEGEGRCIAGRIQRLGGRLLHCCDQVRLHSVGQLLFNRPKTFRRGPTERPAPEDPPQLGAGLLVIARLSEGRSVKTAIARKATRA